MFIQTETTPNPASLKFLPGVEVMVNGTADFENAEAAEVSPLARDLFRIDGVGRVFFGNDFVAVTKGQGDWQHIKAPILGVIMDHYQANRPLFDDENAGQAASADAGDAADDLPDSEIVVQIKDLLDTRVRPAVAQDGGDIIFHGYNDGVVFLKMQGACAGCPSSTATLKHGIENLLRYYIPEITEVQPVEV